jgi:hydroxypyruvate reductase
MGEALEKFNQSLKKMRADAESIFKAGLAAVAPESAVARYCRIEDERLWVGSRCYNLAEFKNIYVIGCGKAAAAMAKAIERLLGQWITAGIVVVKYGHLAHLSRIRIIEAGHPVPDRRGEEGARAILALAEPAGHDDLVLCLISGGGSALLPLPAPGLSLADKQAAAKVMIACGATIHEINAIRKHSSAIKGGLLARAVHPATLVTLVLSDVVGDDLDVIASGPCVPDASSFEDCLAILDDYRISDQLPKVVVDHLKAGAAGNIPETPKAGDPVFQHGFQLIVGSNLDAVKAAGAEAARIGYPPLILSSMLEGDTRQAALLHGGIIKEVLKSGHPLPPPTCLLSGGETTVVVRGKGLGGRNQEFALALAPRIAGHTGVVALSAGTDGTDGPTDAAGAIVDGTTIKRAEALGLNYRRYLESNDAYYFFKQTGELLFTGPTNTNVMDMRVILVCNNQCTAQGSRDTPILT